MAGPINSKATLSGILADPAVANQFKDALLVSLKPEAARLEAVVKARTPVYSGERISSSNPPSGSLRAGVEGKIRPTKKGVAVIVAADKAKRKPTKGDSGLSEAKLAANLTKVQEAIRKGKKFTRASRSQALVKGSRRYGEVPYGVFVNNSTGFLDDTVLAEQGRTLEAINNAVGAWVQAKNAAPITPAL